MKIGFNTLNFGKKYISKVNIPNLKKGCMEEMDFIQFEKCAEDKIQIAKTIKSWNADENVSSKYHNVIYEDYCTDYRTYKDENRYYGIENKKGKIQALMKTTSVENNCKKNHVLFVELLGVNPKHQHESKKRKYSKLGTTSFQEALKIAKEEDYDCLSLDPANEDFWKEMPYLKKTEFSRHNYRRTISSKKFDKCLKKLKEIIQGK